MKQVEQMFGKGRKGAWSRILCVDPGTKRTGLAFWDVLQRSTSRRKYTEPLTTELLRETKGDWEQRIERIVENFQSILESWNTLYVVIESQEFWSGSAKSIASSSRGEVFKVSHLVGQLSRVVKVVTGRRVILVSPTLWKGQLSKRAIDNRLKRAFGKTYPADVSDAVGIGLAIQGGI